jgi:hypothetical protein
MQKQFVSEKISVGGWLTPRVSGEGLFSEIWPKFDTMRKYRLENANLGNRGWCCSDIAR